MASQAKKIAQPNERGAIGRQGEDLAAAFLQKEGFRIIARNWRCRAGEIDLIAQRDLELRFVEVKTRRGMDFGYPEESVTYAKRQHLVRALEYWLQQHPSPGISCQIDVLSVLLTTQPPTIDWLQNISLS